VAALVRLVELTQALAKGSLPKLLRMAVEHPSSRREVLTQLMVVLLRAEAAAADTGAHAAVLRSSAREVAATSMPSLVVRRVLDMLYYLAANSARVTADLLCTSSLSHLFCSYTCCH
jgi:hypothetical protein